MRRWFASVLVVVMVAVVAVVAVPPVSVASQPPTVVSVRVPATREAWTDTGIELREGETVSISAAGAAGWNPAVLSGPAGTAVEICTPAVATAPLGALVGRVGDRPPVVVGGAATLRGPGRVALLYNDCPGQYFDNTDGFDIRLLVTAAPLATTAPTAASMATVEPAATAAATPDALITPEPASSRANPGALLAAGALVLVVGALGYRVVARRRSRVAAADTMGTEAPPEPVLVSSVERTASLPFVGGEPAPLPAPPGAPLPTAAPAVLTVRAGPLAGRQVPVWDEPVTIGTGRDCTLVLPGDDPAVERRHARIWRRDGRYMLHRLGRRGTVMLDGHPVEWVVLESDDQFAIGSHEFSFNVR